MTQRIRVRRKNDIELFGRPDFYCRVHQGRVVSGGFEQSPTNRGVCFGCAIFIAHDIGEWSVWGNTIEKSILDAPVLARSATEASMAIQEKQDIQRLKKWTNEPGWIYYVSQGDLIKIGYSASPRSRMKAYGPTAKLLAIHPGTKALEKDMHQKFHRDLSQGREWFNPSETLMAHVADVLRRFGSPDVFAYSFRKRRSTLDTPKGSGVRFVA